MTPQEYYNKLIRCSVDGTFPSYGTISGSKYVGEAFNCRYRYKDEKGKIHACAIGILAPTKRSYESHLAKHEGRACYALPDKEVKWLLSRISPKVFNMGDFFGIQEAHDGSVLINERSEVIGFDCKRFITTVNEIFKVACRQAKCKIETCRATTEKGIRRWVERLNG